MGETEYEYTAICHTPCYWLDTLWTVGETYEGNIVPSKHFSDSGKKDPSVPPPSAGSDPNITIELVRVLENSYGVSVPDEWSRKVVWAKLVKFENDSIKDALTTEDMPQYVAACGFESKTNAGVGAHERHCDVCKEIKDGDSS